MRRLRIHLALALAIPAVLSGCTFDIYDLPMPGKKVGEDNSFEVKADFADALNVVPRSAVMVGDVPVGQVEAVERSGWNARVTMRIRKDVELPDNAEAQIRQTSLLGEKFVQLSPPETDDGGTASVGRLGPNDVIGLDQTGRNPEVEEVLGALSLLLSGGGIGQLKTITHELNAMMEGRTGEIRGVLRRLNTLVSTLNTQRDDIIGVMESLNGLSKTLVSEKDAIADALEAAGPAIDVLRGQHDEIVGMLRELDKLGSVGTRVVNAIKDDLIADLRHLEPVLRSLADTGDSLVPGLVAALSYPFPIEAADTIRGDYANVVFKMQFNLSPVSEGGILPTTPEELVRICRAFPTAPICSGGGALDQLCSVVATLPLCTTGAAAQVGTAAAPKASAPTAAAAPPPTLAPAPAAPEVSTIQKILDKVGGLLGGGSS